MQEILNKLNELVGICETRVRKVETERSELFALRGTLNAQKESQADQAKDIKNQNKELDQRKLLVKTVDEALAIFKATMEEKKRLKAFADDLDLQKSEHAKKMEEDKSEIQRQKDKCAAMNAETEKKAKDFEDGVIKKILRKAVTE